MFCEILASSNIDIKVLIKNLIEDVITSNYINIYEIMCGKKFRKIKQLV
jgi:hypothetical protein